MLLMAGEAVWEALVSKAHCCFAPSNWRRLLMQAFCCEVVRARTKLGIAMAASKPMMATTIMISTSVNPCLFDLLLFISTLTFLLRGLNTAIGVLLFSFTVVHFADCQPHLRP